MNSKSEYLYELHNLSCFYRDKCAIFVEDLKIEKGKTIGLMGPNGSGKSTLLKVMSFLLPYKGELLFNGSSGSKNLDVSMLLQEPFLLRRSVYDNIAYGLSVRGIKKNGQNYDEYVYDSLDRVGLVKDFAKRLWYELSGGEAQRVALAARLALRPKALLLDEPTASVDERSAVLIRDAIMSIKEEWNTTLLIASHDYLWLSKVADDMLMIVNNNIIGHEQMNLISENESSLDLWDGENGRAVSGKIAALNPSDVNFSSELNKKLDKEIFCSTTGIVIQISLEKNNSAVAAIDCGFVLRGRLHLNEMTDITLGKIVSAYFKRSAIKWL